MLLNCNQVVEMAEISAYYIKRLLPCTSLRKTTGRDESPTCPKCNLEEETPNHHIGACTYYQALRRKVFGEEKTTIKSVVQKLNINLLAKYLQQAGRLAEYGQ